MSPIFLIVYVVIVTLLLTLFYPRLNKVDPRILLISTIAGIVVLLGFIAFIIIR